MSPRGDYGMPLAARRVKEREETCNLPLVSIKYTFYFLHCFCSVKPCTLNNTQKYTETIFKKENLYFYRIFSGDEAHFENLSLNVAVSVLLSEYMKDFGYYCVFH